MKTFYFKPRRDHESEFSFFNYLIKLNPQARHSESNYKLEDHLINKLISVEEVIGHLKKDSKLPAKRRSVSIEWLTKLPNEVRVAKSMSDVSVDLAVEIEGAVILLEFHEVQHRKLKVNRPSPIFDKDYKKYEIPRFVQRLLKDIWRWKYLPNYKVVWWDWFDKYKDGEEGKALLFENKKEYFLKDYFSFTEFCETHEIQEEADE